MAHKKPSIALESTPTNASPLGPPELSTDGFYQTQAHSGQYVPPITIDERCQESIEESEEIGLSPAVLKDIRDAAYEAGLMVKYADDTVAEWHRVSNTLHNGKGWADIARKKLDLDVQVGKRKSFSAKDVRALSRNIQNKVVAYRKNLDMRLVEDSSIKP